MTCDQVKFVIHSWITVISLTTSKPSLSKMDESKSKCMQVVKPVYPYSYTFEFLRTLKLSAAVIVPPVRTGADLLVVPFQCKLWGGNLQSFCANMHSHAEMRLQEWVKTSGYLQKLWSFVVENCLCVFLHRSSTSTQPWEAQRGNFALQRL